MHYWRAIQVCCILKGKEAALSMFVQGYGGLGGSGGITLTRGWSNVSMTLLLL